MAAAVSCHRSAPFGTCHGAPAHTTALLVRRRHARAYAAGLRQGPELTRCVCPLLQVHLFKRNPRGGAGGCRSDRRPRAGRGASGTMPGDRRGRTATPGAIIGVRPIALLDGFGGGSHCHRRPWHPGQDGRPGWAASSSPAASREPCERCPRRRALPGARARRSGARAVGQCLELTSLNGMRAYAKCDASVGSQQLQAAWVVALGSVGIGGGLWDRSAARMPAEMCFACSECDTI